MREGKEAKKLAKNLCRADAKIKEEELIVESEKLEQLRLSLLDEVINFMSMIDYLKTDNNVFKIDNVIIL